MKILITGATGYVGKRLVHAAQSRGFHVAIASRRPPTASSEWIPFDLRSTEQMHLPQDIDAVIHLAAGTQPNFIEPSMEQAAAGVLIKECQRIGARFLYVSSQTARKDAPTVYGKTKWEIEKLVTASGGYTIRPGLVYGGPEEGLFGTLVGLVRALPVMPAFVPPPKVQPIHVDDLAIALLNCSEAQQLLPSTLCVGDSRPVSFSHFLKSISRNRLKKHRLLLPVPALLIKFLNILLGSRTSTKLGLDGLISLFTLPEMDTESDLALLGLALRPMSAGMTLSGGNSRRTLTLEATALLSYILKQKPTSALVRRYVRCIEQLRGGKALQLPQPILYFPMSIALFDDIDLLSAEYATELAWRIDSAVVLGEASVQGAEQFLTSSQKPEFLKSAALATRAIIAELVWRLLGFILRPLLKKILKKSVAVST